MRLPDGTVPRALGDRRSGAAGDAEASGPRPKGRAGTRQFSTSSISPTEVSGQTGFSFGSQRIEAVSPKRQIFLLLIAQDFSAARKLLGICLSLVVRAATL